MKFGAIIKHNDRWAAFFRDVAHRIYVDNKLDPKTIPAIHVTDDRRGRYHFRGPKITLPRWLTTRPLDFVRWYVAHELAHGIAGPSAAHGPLFQETLQKLVPEEYHWEATYKPGRYAQQVRGTRTTTQSDSSEETDRPE